MRYRYLDDFRRCISVFAIFSHGIGVLGTPQCPPLYRVGGMIASIRGIKPQVYRAIILKRMADHSQL